MAFGRFNQQETVFTGYEQARPVAHEGMETRLNFLKKVYSLFFASILFACGGAYLGMTTLAPAIAKNYFLFSILEIGLIFFAMAVRQKEGLNLLALFAFTSLSGALPGPWLAHLAATQPGVILQTFILTAGVFGGLTVYVFAARKDFSFMGGFLFVGLLVLIIGGLANIFIASSAMHFAMSACGVLLFAGFILYDTSNIVLRYPSNEYVAGALSLYLDFLNLFINLLSLLSGGRDE